MMRPKSATIAARAFAALVTIACLLALPGCFGLPEQPQVAATVNGEEILENEVTEYIEGFRFKNDTYGTYQGWADFLASVGYTPSTFRVHVLESTFIPEVLVRQECEKRKIVVTDDQLDMAIEKEKAYYEQRYGADSWDSVLASFGYDEKSWRENEEYRLLEEQLTDVVIENKKAKKSDILRQARANGTDYNGKHSYYIAFESEQKAQEAYESVSKYANGKMSLKRFKKLGKQVNAGWNSLPAARDKLSTEYLNVLNEMDAGELSKPVVIDGKHVLVFCDDVFACPSEITYSRLNSFPKAIYEQIAADADKQHVEDAYMEWLRMITRDSDIRVAPMPDGLPYATE